MSDGGKGDRPRPYSVSQEEFANNFDRIFGKKKQNNQQSTEKENNGNGTLDGKVSPSINNAIGDNDAEKRKL